ncbi:hypothetical protein RvY_03171 [Ramazzottius varieornatus]|uniref:ZP domain-containing protein n=1 Tax=Ramazzottius varieornatus TaxID=947166 RepID=A0A1D1UM51_RAMVA|nr:hypothetical protein RvY_03171 [Ramazzottius varieornatus]
MGDMSKALHKNITFVSEPSAAMYRQVGMWNSSDLVDFDNAIDYTNSSDLTGAASERRGYSSSRGNYAEGRQYDGQGDSYKVAYMPLITYFDVKCDKKGMHVHVEFNKPFNGIIFSKGFFNSPDCRYVPAKSYGKIFDFTVPVDYCGTSGEDHAYDYKDSYFENTLIIQFDEYIQEVWDLAKTVRCEWNAYYDKSVAVRPFSVGNLDPVLYRFNGDNIESWIQVQKGKGPLAEEVYGIVKVGDPLTLVIGIKDYEGKFDLQVKDCFATDGYGARVQLTDYYGCVVRDKIMSPFRKVKDYGPQATAVAYAYFQAFKFPDRYEVGIKCNIQVCLGKCQGGCPSGDYGSGGGGGVNYAGGDSYQEPGYTAPGGAYGGGASGGGGGGGYDKGAYSNSVPSRGVDLSNFGPGPYVPDLPVSAPNPPNGPYMTAYDTSNALGAALPPSGPSQSSGPYDGSPSSNVRTTLLPGNGNNGLEDFADESYGSRPKNPPPKKTTSGGSSDSGLDPYRRKRNANDSAVASSGVSGSMASMSITSVSETAGSTDKTGDMASSTVQPSWTVTVSLTSSSQTDVTSGARQAAVRNASHKSGRTAKIIQDDGQINLDGKFKVIAAHDIQSDNINAGPQEVSLAKPSSICIAVSSFTVAVTLLSAILVLSVLVTFFVCLRLRRSNRKLSGYGSEAVLQVAREIKPVQSIFSSSK